MTYEQAIEKLQLNHLYPTVVKKITKKGEDIIGLEISAPEIRVDGKMEVLSKVLGDGWNISRLPNEGVITIKSKR
jgi:hypothetical protein